MCGIQYFEQQQHSPVYAMGIGHILCGEEWSLGQSLLYYTLVVRYNYLKRIYSGYESLQTPIKMSGFVM